MKTHTPGPWATSRDAVPDGHVQITVYAEATGNRVATAFEDEGNAPLISAAPDMLDILERIANSCEEFVQDPDCDADPYDMMEAMARDARAAIAKAQP